MKISNRRGFIATGFAAVTASLLLAPTGSVAQQSIGALEAAAKKEGSLVIKGAPGKVFTQVFTEGFKKKYPGIKVTYTGLRGFESIPRIRRERKAGIYTWDIYIGGTPSVLGTLKPEGVFMPIKPALVLFPISAYGTN